MSKSTENGWYEQLRAARELMDRKEIPESIVKEAAEALKKMDSEAAKEMKATRSKNDG